jgi:hypothetical protein
LKGSGEENMRSKEVELASKMEHWFLLVRPQSSIDDTICVRCNFN